MKITKSLEAVSWPKQEKSETKHVDVSLISLMKHAEIRTASEAEGYRSNPTDGNTRL